MRSLLFAALSFVACRDRGPRFFVKDGFVRDVDGRALILRGMNVSNGQKSAPYLDDDAASDFVRMREEWGMNAVRFVTSWAAIEEDGYLEAMHARLQMIRSAGLYIVIDMHQDLFGVGFDGGNGMPRFACGEERYAAFKPRSPWLLGYLDANVIACFDDFWESQDLQLGYLDAVRRMARAVGDNDAVIGLDVMNEPFWGSANFAELEEGVLASFYDDVIAAARDEQPAWLGFFEPSSARNLGVATHLRIDAQNAVYAPHLYDPGAEQNLGFDAARRDALIANAHALGDEARERGVPLWIGEYGGQPAHGGFAAYMDAVYDAAASELAGLMYWHFGRDAAYGVRDRDGRDKQEVLDAIVRPYPQVIAGAPVSFSFDEVTKEALLAWKPDAGIAAPTILAVPERVYRDGFEVRCDDCVFDRGKGILTITRAKTGRVTINPL